MTQIVDVYSLFDTVYSINYDTGWASIACPHPHHHNSQNAGFNIFTNTFRCMGKCQKTIRDLDKILYFLQVECGQSVLITFLEDYQLQEKVKKENVVDLDNIDKFTLAYDNDYMMKRKVSNDIIKEYNIRYYNNRIYVPSYNINGKITGYNTRSTRYKSYKYLGIKNSFLREDKLLTYDVEQPLYIVEGMFGEFRLFSLKKQVCSMLGSNLLNNAILGRFKRIYGCFDDDEAGYGYARNLKANNHNAVVLEFREWDEIDEKDL